MNGILLETKNLTKIFESGFLRKTIIKAVDNVNLVLKESEVVSLAGQSGSGKTTLAKMILRILEPTSGKIIYKGKNIWRDLKSLKDLKWYWRNVHIIFQNPFSNFNPFYKIDRALRQALELIGVDPDSSEGKRLVKEALEVVGLRPDETLGKYPHQLSGGQLQRIMIARAWIVRPKLLLADEPVSMLDVSTRGKILELFLKLREAQKTTILFITHDFGLAYAVSDRILIMYKGKIIEEGPPDEVLFNPKHEYTKQLIESVPTLYRKWRFEL
ncbi:MAG: ABC transporter ATP-binding protein [Thermoprotei archaeon]|nr:MAG: ABC transporter ATP-binding protein [Thermoprotei archaeon]